MTDLSEWIEEARADHGAAESLISDLCSGKREWTMRTPVQDGDPLMVIAAVLDALPRALDELEKALGDARSWKARNEAWRETLQVLHDRAEQAEAEAAQWQEAAGQASVRAEQLEDRLEKAGARARELEAHLAEADKRIGELESDPATLAEREFEA